MRIEAMVAAVMLASFTGATGYYLGATADRPVWELPRNASVGSDYLASCDSFSDVERLNTMLDALAMQYVDQAQRLFVQDYMMRTRRGPTDGQEREGRFYAAVRLLEEGLEEFRGSRQEVILLPTLLYGLRHQGSYDRWLNTYLDILTRHPKVERVLALSHEAMQVAHLVCREDDVALAMMRVTHPLFDPPHLSPPGDGSSLATVWGHGARS